MVYVILIILGLGLGSFVNALVWRVHEQAAESAKKNPSKERLSSLSITTGRSMCPHCKHQLQTKDLIPVASWLSTKGKCRYCGKPISIQYPVVELGTAVLFVAVYTLWPHTWSGVQYLLFAVWLLLLTGLLALFVYDLRWKLLPNRILMPLTGIGMVIAVLNVATAPKPAAAFLNTVLSVAVGGGLFYVLFQISDGKWIGGGDVKLGWLLGLVLATPGRSALMIFLASLLGTLISLPLLLTHKVDKKSSVPFGPLLITGAVAVLLFGESILSWYERTFFPFI
jgi:prepilin signal peptidase PulO-like enzyme (type II secretory pathway)